MEKDEKPCRWSRRTWLCGLAGLAATLALPGCSGEGGRYSGIRTADRSNASQSLQGRWRVVMLEAHRPLNDTEISVDFENPQQVSGNAGENEFQAKLVMTGNGQFDAHDIVVTQRFARRPPGLMEQEGRFLRLLRQADRWEMRDEGQTLLYYRHRPVLVLEPS